MAGVRGTLFNVRTIGLESFAAALSFPSMSSCFLTGEPLPLSMAFVGGVVGKGWEAHAGAAAALRQVGRGKTEVAGNEGSPGRPPESDQGKQGQAKRERPGEASHVAPRPSPLHRRPTDLCIRVDARPASARFIHGQSSFRPPPNSRAVSASLAPFSSSPTPLHAPQP